MTVSGKTPVNVHIPSNLRKKVVAIARAKYLSLTAVVTQALELWLKENG
jgi:hypothetical protein